MAATNNAVNITSTGLARYDGAGTFTAETVTQHAVAVGGAAAGNLVSKALTNGQILIGSTGVVPVAATITQGSGVVVTSGAGSIKIDAVGGALTWSDTSGAVLTVINNGYFCSAAATPTLPAAPSEGDVVAVIVDAGALVTITANAGQKIRLGNTLSAAAGTCATSTQGNAIFLVYRTSGTTWIALSAVGSWTIT